MNPMEKADDIYQKFINAAADIGVDRNLQAHIDDLHKSIAIMNPMIDDHKKNGNLKAEKDFAYICYHLYFLRDIALRKLASLGEW